MNNYKIAFFDIDGTIIDMEKKKMTKCMEDTLVKLKEKGFILCIATGRPLQSIPKFDKQIFDVYLSFNGSYCLANGEVIYKKPIEHDDVMRIINNAKEINRSVSLANESRMGANGTDQDLDEYYAFSGQKVEIAEDFDNLAQNDIYQIMMGAYKDDYDKILKDVRSAKIAAWWDRAIDIIPKQAGKGEAIKRILEYYHFDKSEAIAFGDGENDIEMLQSVGKGIAMGNANEKVKSIADEICESVSEEGIYKYCVSHSLI